MVQIAGQVRNPLTGGNSVTTLHRLFGDSDGDGDVGATDFAAFRQSFGSANSIFDFDNDGDVDSSDMGNSVCDSTM